MTVSIIVAVSASNAIGVGGDLPWHIPEDLQRFKAITMGKPIIMGRATWESIGRALPGRKSIVLTRQKGFAADGCEVAHSPQEALEIAGDVDEVLVIGGGKIYAQMLPLADRIYLTRVHASVDGDAYFPVLDKEEWSVIDREEFRAGDARSLAFTCETLVRRSTGSDHHKSLL
jgi:dihydrofolate reductase